MIFGQIGLTGVLHSSVPHSRPSEPVPFDRGTQLCAALSPPALGPRNLPKLVRKGAGGSFIYPSSSNPPNFTCALLNDLLKWSVIVPCTRVLHFGAFVIYL